MSDDRDLERRLDAAFAAARPRRGFEAELWARLEARRPWWRRARGWSLAPALGAAAVLVIAAGVLAVHPWSPGGSGGASSNSGSPYQAPTAGQGAGSRDQALPLGPQAAAVGLPPPSALGLAPGGQPPLTGDGRVAYYGPASLTWAGTLPVLPPVVPVYRYAVPDPAAADGFARGLNSSPRPSPAPSGAYAGSDFDLRLLPLQAGREPMFALVPRSPAGPAESFLADRGLRPGWPAVQQKDASGGRLRLVRQFDIPGFGAAGQVDQRGEPAGLEAQLNPAGSVLAVTGPLPLAVVVQWSAVRPAERVIADATTGGQAGAPAVRLTQAKVVYIAVNAGDHGYFEPAYLLTGNFELNGRPLEMRVLVAGV